MSFSARTYYFLGLIALLGIAGQWLGGAWYQLWRVPAAFLLLAILYEWWLMRKISFAIGCNVAANLPLGRSSVFSLVLTNTTAARLRIEAEMAFSPEFQSGPAAADNGMPRSCVLNPHESVALAYRINATALGEFRPGNLYARMLGCLGLMWWRRNSDIKRVLRVIPDSLNSADRRHGLIRHGARPQRVQAGSEAGAELLQLRDYRPGDPMRMIDWKATARSGKPVVRVFSEEQQLELVLVLDAGRGSRLQLGGLTLLYHYANIAARLSEAALSNGDRVGLVSFADELIETTGIGRGLPALLNIREHLQRLRTRNTESNPLMAALYLKTLLKRRGLVIFLTEIGGQDSTSQLIKATGLLAPKHMAMIAGVMNEDIDRMRYETTGSWLDAYRNYAAQEYMHAVRRNVMHLRRLGGQVILAKGAELDGSVMQGYESLRRKRSV
jgi:uncharacterized protein (DUF58 family)